jgi:F-type H+-transporting ATPase subunit b
VDALILAQPLVLAGDSVIYFDGHFWAKMITHTVAFLLFVWVLKRYALGPLTQFLDARKEKIDAEFDRVEKLQAKAEEMEAQYEAKMRDIDAEARQHVQEAVAAGERLKDEIVAKAKADAEETRSKARQALEMEVAKARIEMRDEIVSMAIAATEKLIRASVDEDRSRALVAEFVQGVDRLEGPGGQG